MNMNSIIWPSFVHPNPTTFNSPRCQNFSIPFCIASYFSKKSYKVLEKLQKTCKYFYAKNKIIVINQTYGNHENGLLCCVALKKNFHDFLKIKFWLKNELKFFKYKDDESEYSAPLKIPLNIYRCSFRYFYIADQTLTMDELDFLLGGEKIFWFSLEKVNITNVNGVPAFCGQILSKLPALEHFNYSCNNEIFTNETFQKMTALKFKYKLSGFRLEISNLSPKADISFLCDFVKKNGNEKSNFSFYMKMENPDTHREILQSLFNEMPLNLGTNKKANIEVN